jgi:hypothetical protein
VWNTGSGGGYFDLNGSELDDRFHEFGSHGTGWLLADSSFVTS